MAVLSSCKKEKKVKITVMTYNVRYGLAEDGENSWQYRKTDMLALIKIKKLDFLGTQEGLPFQVNYIKKTMPNYEFIGKDRDGNGKGENTAIFYNKLKYKVVINHTFWLAKNQTKSNKDWDAVFPRIYTYGLFEHIQSKKQIWIINTHFDHIGVVARQESAKIILKKIKEIKKEKNIPVVFMGDLNALPESKVVKEISTILYDTNKESEEISTFNGFVYNNPIKKHIDYIFITKNNIKIEKYEILTNSKDSKYPSDHFPVYTELTF